MSHQQFARAVLGRELVRQTASLLGEIGVEIMPLKGVLLQQTVYRRDPSARKISDVDVLVQPWAFGRALALLTRHGFERRHEPVGMMEVSLWAPSGVVLDLHRQLFTTGRYRMSSRDVFARAARDTHLFDAPVSLQNPYDTFAHLVGSAGSDHADVRWAERFRELARLPRMLGLDPGAAAKHLHACGLQRAGIYALRLAVRVEPQPEVACILDHLLIGDPVGARLTFGAGWVIERTTRESPLASLAAHSLNPTLGRAAVSLACVLGNRLRHRLSAKGPSKPPGARMPHKTSCTGAGL